jgi:hypothetical protein
MAAMMSGRSISPRRAARSRMPMVAGHFEAAMECFFASFQVIGQEGIRVQLLRE